MAAKVIPARLSWLTIYNPTLTRNDDDFRDQVVFYYSRDSRAKRRHGTEQRTKKSVEDENAEENNKLRQVGLSRAMVDFARDFSDGKPVDSVETEKSRIVLKELEKNWWILASIDLTRLPVGHKPAYAPAGKPVNDQSSPADGSSETTVEYSARELSPTPLLIQQLQSAHSIFLLHQGASLDEIFARVTRTKFCSFLDRFWNKFAATWDVLLHGNPVIEMCDALKLAAGGELGMGVGEEEWGSGEREVLEDFVGRTDGLLDMIISRFGEPSRSAGKPKSSSKSPIQKLEDLEPWMGIRSQPASSDGVVFAGIGAISRGSLKDISHWMSWVYAFGDLTYGIRENPSSNRRAKGRTGRSTTVSKNPKPEVRDTSEPPAPGSPAPAKTHTPSSNVPPERPFQPGIPPPILSPAVLAKYQASSAGEARSKADQGHSSIHPEEFHQDVWLKYLKLGYGTAWSIPGTTESARSPSRTRTDSISKDDDHSSKETIEAESKRYEQALQRQIKLENEGHFVIGLRGDLNEQITAAAASDLELDADDAEAAPHYTMLRTLHIELSPKMSKHSSKGQGHPDTKSSDTPDKRERDVKRVQVLLYVHRPFITAFLFEPRTPSLSLPSFYRNIHAELGPLHVPLTSSTSLSRVTSRIAQAATTYKVADQIKAGYPLDRSPDSPREINPIYDLTIDASSLTLYCNIPNIPEPMDRLMSSGASPLKISASRANEWNRVEAMGVHLTALNLMSPDDRYGVSGPDREISAKTGRGWWVVWLNLEEDPKKTGEERTKQALIVRKASGTHTGSAARERNSSMGTKGFWSMMGMGRALEGSSSESRLSGGRGQEAGRLMEGAGIDARRYVEGLIALGR